MCFINLFKITEGSHSAYSALLEWVAASIVCLAFLWADGLISSVKPYIYCQQMVFLEPRTGCGVKLLFEKRKLSKGNSESY